MHPSNSPTSKAATKHPLFSAPFLEFIFNPNIACRIRYADVIIAFDPRHPKQEECVFGIGILKQIAAHVRAPNASILQIPVSTARRHCDRECLLACIRVLKGATAA